MSIFGAMNIAGTGLVVDRKWLDAVSDNIANMNNVVATDADAFQARYVMAQANTYGSPGGVSVSGLVWGSKEGRIVNDPTHPLADENGNVKLPDIDLADQMAQLMLAQRAYQANLAVVDRAKTAYESAIGIGK